MTDPLIHWLTDAALTVTPLLAVGLAAAAVARGAGTRVVLLRATLAGTAVLLLAAAVPGRRAVWVGEPVVGPDARVPGPADPAPPGFPLAASRGPGSGYAPGPRPLRPPAAPSPARPATPTPAPPVIAPPADAPRPVPSPVTPLVALWLLGCAGMSVRLGVGAVRARRLAHAGRVPPAWLNGEWGDVTGNSDVPLRICSHHPQALVAGCLRPTVLLPARLATRGADPDERAAALRHEWAHVVHGDPRWSAAARWIAVPLWWHPLVHVVKRRVRAEGELLADAAAADALTPERYAAALLAWARHGAGRPLPGAVAALRSGGGLTRRVDALLSGRTHRPLPRSRRFALTAAVLLTAGTLAPWTASGGEQPPGEVERTGGGEGERDEVSTSELLSRSSSPPRTSDAVIPVPRWQHWEEPADVRRDPFTLTGTVYGKDRKPLPGATVDLQRRPRGWTGVQGPEHPIAHHPLARVTTDAGGKFAVTLERWVPLTVAVAKAGQAIRWQHLYDPPAGPLSIRTAHTPGSIRGRLVTPAGEPAADVPVRVVRLIETAQLARKDPDRFAGPSLGPGYASWADDDDLLIAVTDADGRFTLPGLPVKHTAELRVGGGGSIQPATLYAAVGEKVPADVTWFFGREVRASPFKAEVAPGRTVVVEVVTTRWEPIAGVRVVRNGFELSRAVNPTRLADRLAAAPVTGADGTVTFRGVSDDAFHVALIPPDDLPFMHGSYTVPAVGGPGFEHAAALDSGRRVDGRVVDAVTGEGVPGVAVDISTGPNNRPPRYRASPAQGWTDAAGAFRVVVPEPLPRVVVLDAPPGYRVKEPGDIAAIPQTGDVRGVLLQVHPTGRVRAVVRDADGTPVADAAVRVGSIPHGDHSHHGGPTGRTDEAGTVSLALPGAVEFEALAGVIVTAVSPNRSRAAVRDLAGVSRVGEITLTLAPAATLTGRVVDPDGEPVAGAVLRTYESTGNGISRATGPTTRTDAEGRFTMTGLIPGLPGSLHVVAEGYVSPTDVDGPRHFELEPGETVERTITLRPLPPPAGPPGVPVSRRKGPGDGGRQVGRPSGSAGRPGASPTHDPEGRATVGAADPRRAEPAPVLRGTVVGPDGEPVAGVLVEGEARHEGPGGPDEPFHIRTHRETTRTAADGSFTLALVPESRGLPPGVREISPPFIPGFPASGAESGNRRPAGTTFHLTTFRSADGTLGATRSWWTAEEVAGGVRVALEPAGHVRGRVVDLAGEPVSAASVTLHRIEGLAPIDRHRLTAPVSVAADGSFRFTDDTVENAWWSGDYPLTPGSEYAVRVDPGAGYVAANRYDRSPHVHFTPNAGRTRTVDVPVAPATGTVSGRVTDWAGVPQADVPVRGFFRATHRGSEFGDFASAKTGPDGRFTLTNLPDGGRGWLEAKLANGSEWRRTEIDVGRDDLELPGPVSGGR